MLPINLHSGVSYSRGDAVEANCWCVLKGHCLSCHLKTCHFFAHDRIFTMCTYFYRCLGSVVNCESWPRACASSATTVNRVGLRLRAEHLPGYVDKDSMSLLHHDRRKYLCTDENRLDNYLAVFNPLGLFESTLTLTLNVFSYSRRLFVWIG